MSRSISQASAELPRARGASSATAVLAIAAFVIVTTEFLMVGLLPSLARDLDVTVSAAGQLVTLFAVVVMALGPLLTAWLANRERRQLFVAVLLLFAGANALAAVSPNLWVLGIARVIPALALPVFWGTASESAAQLAGADGAGKAVARVYLGISGAMLLGIPLGTLAGEALGWRGAFWGLAALSLVTAALVHRVMPKLIAARPASAREQAAILRDPAFLANVALSVIVFTAMFTAYTYLAAFLEIGAGIASGRVGWWMMGFGVVGLAGNWLGGRWVDRRPLVTTAVFTTILAAGMLSAVAWEKSTPLLLVALVAWGIANTALYPICQIRVMKSARGAQALAGTINVSAANAGIALGAVLGGLTIPAWGIVSVCMAGAVLALAATASTLLVAGIERSRASAI